MIHDNSTSTSNSKYITSNFNKMRCLVNKTTKHNTYCSFSTRHLSSNENGLWYLSAMLSIIDDKMTMMILVRIHSIHRHRYRSCLYATQQQQMAHSKLWYTCMRMNQPAHYSSVMYTFNLSFCVHSSVFRVQISWNFNWIYWSNSHPTGMSCIVIVNAPQIADVKDLDNFNVTLQNQLLPDPRARMNVVFIHALTHRHKNFW